MASEGVEKGRVRHTVTWKKVVRKDLQSLGIHVVLEKV